MSYDRTVEYKIWYVIVKYITWKDITVQDMIHNRKTNHMIGKYSTLYDKELSNISYDRTVQYKIWYRIVKYIIWLDNAIQDMIQNSQIYHMIGQHSTRYDIE